MTRLFILIISLLFLGCSDKKDEIKINLERIITKAETVESFPGLSNIFFETPEKNFTYSKNWTNPEVAVLSEGEGFKTVHVLRHNQNNGKFEYYVDTDADLDFTDESQLNFVQRGERLIADVLVTIKPQDIPVYFQVMEKGKWTYGRISEFRKGNITIKGEPVDFILRPRFRNHPIYSDSSGTTFLIDFNSNGNYTSQWKVTDDDKLLASEEIDITQPFQIDGEKYEVKNIDSKGSSLTIIESDTEVAPVQGFKTPNFIAEDLEGKPQSLTDFLDKPVLLEFWSTSCPFCEVVRPELNKIKEQYDDRLNLVIMARGKDKSEIKEHLKEYPKKGHFLLHSDKAWNTFNPVIATPTFYLIDNSNTIQIKTTGANTINVIKEKLKEIAS
ncbi:MAG: TlpA family protein disulfide reductase [Bacteroidota bacterium]